MALKIQLRRGTAAEWTSANPVLMQGEMGVETDTLKVKLGNGTTAWTSLPYFTQGAKGDKGDTGATGATGPQGSKGDIGDTGPANELTVGTVTTGAPGTDAVVTITGDAPNQTISFTIPEGIQGIQGIQGEKGDTGLGVPEGGTEGQIIVRTIDGTVWQDNYARNIEQAVKNTTGSTLTKGTAVYISGATGDNALVAKAQANSEMTSSKTFGLLAANIPNDGFGAVITEGTLYGVDTSAASAGDPVWLSPSTAGGLVFGLANRPVAPNHAVYLGIVLRAHAVNGSIFVKVQNGYELDELHDVLITTPADKQVLQYESSSQLWKNKTASGGVRVSESEPEDTISGDGWFYSEDGTLFVRYDDGDSVQWVQPNAVLSSQIEQRYYSPNYVINGGFDIWQRGTSSGWANAYTTADRWFTNSSASTSWAQDSTNVAGGCRFSIRATVGSGAPADPIILQAIETSNVLPLAGKTVTMSAFVSTSSSSNVRLTVEWSANTDNALTGSWTNVNTQTFVSTSSLTRYSMTTTIPANARSLRVVVGTNGTIPANATMNVTGVQLEEGVTASPFRRNANSIQGELAACQRYYQTSNSKIYGAMAVPTDPARIVGIFLPVQMRTVITPSDVSLTWGTAGTSVVVGDNNSASNISTYLLVGNTTTYAQLFSYTVNKEL